ncbi:MAG: O-antigen ligase family protein [Methyloprofundus sp.]|nr:O-antigen ligase family protein [Methyloprofundus sp.]
MMNKLFDSYLTRKYMPTAIMFFLVSGGSHLIYAKLSGVANSSGGNIFFQIVSLSIYGLATYRLLTKHKQIIPFILKSGLPLFLLIALCQASSLWSVDPSTSFRRASALSLTYIYCIYLVARFNLNELIHIVWLVCLLTAIFGLVAIAIPGWGIDHENHTYTTAVRGLAGHKNDFGRYMALGLLISFHLFYFSRISKNILLIFCILFFFLLVLSQSSTSLAVVITIISATPLIRFYVTGQFKNNGKRITPILQRLFFLVFFISIFSWTAMLILIEVIELLGKDLTLTGRTTLWEYALDIGQKHPWLGTGYRTFWTENISDTFFFYHIYWAPNDAIGNGHNGLLDVYLELGYLGIIVFFIFLFSFMKTCLLNLCRKINYPKQHIFVFSILNFYLIYSITEQMTLKQSEFLWMIIMILYMAALKNIYLSINFFQQKKIKLPQE